MSFQCYLCDYKTLQIKDICSHLRNVHMLFESSNLILKCCTDCIDCPAVFRTYCGFTKHLKKCIIQKENVPSTSNDYKNSDVENSDDFKEFDIIDNSCNSIDNKNVVSNESDTEKRQLIQENISNYVIYLYSLGLPDLVITNILETKSNLIFPFIDDLISISNLDERQNLAHDFRYAFENHMTVYKRNKNLPKNVMQPIQKAHGIKIKKNMIVKHSAIDKFRLHALLHIYLY